MVHKWVESKGFELLPRQEFSSKSLTCVHNNLGIDVAGFVKTLREEKKISIDGGYGKIKGKTFRISNMGDETVDSINHLISNMDEVISSFLPA
jgi:aspartate aminotransferase-like enzyme